MKRKSLILALTTFLGATLLSGCNFSEPVSIPKAVDDGTTSTTETITPPTSEGSEEDNVEELRSSCEEILESLINDLDEGETLTFEAAYAAVIARLSETGELSESDKEAIAEIIAELLGEDDEDDDHEESGTPERDVEEIAYNPVDSHLRVTMKQYFDHSENAKYGEAQVIVQSKGYIPYLDGFNVIPELLNYYDLFVNDDIIPSYFEQKPVNSATFEEAISSSRMPGFIPRVTMWDYFMMALNNGYSFKPENNSMNKRYIQFIDDEPANVHLERYHNKFGLADLSTEVCYIYNNDVLTSKSFKSSPTFDKLTSILNGYKEAYSLNDTMKFSVAIYNKATFGKVGLQNEIMKELNANRPVVVSSSNFGSMKIVYAYDSITKTFLARSNNQYKESIPMDNIDCAAKIDFSATTKKLAKRFVVNGLLCDAAGLSEKYNNSQLSMVDYFEHADNVDYGSASNYPATKSNYINPYLDSFGALPLLLNYYDLFLNDDFIPSYFEADVENFASWEVMKESNKMPGFAPRHNEYEMFIDDWQGGMGFPSYCTSMDDRWDWWCGAYYPEDRLSKFEDKFGLYDIVGPIILGYKNLVPYQQQPRKLQVSDFEKAIDLYKTAFGLENVIKYTTNYAKIDPANGVYDVSDFVIKELIAGRPVVVSDTNIVYGYNPLSETYLARSNRGVKVELCAEQLEEARSFNFTLSSKKPSYRFEVDNKRCSVYGENVPGDLRIRVEDYFDNAQSAWYQSVEKDCATSSSLSSSPALDGFNGLISVLNFYDLTVNSSIIPSNVKGDNKVFASLEEMKENPEYPGFVDRTTLWDMFYDDYSNGMAFPFYCTSMQSRYEYWLTEFDPYERIGIYCEKLGELDLGANVATLYNKDALAWKFWTGMQIEKVDKAVTAYKDVYDSANNIKFATSFKAAQDLDNKYSWFKSTRYDIMRELVNNRPVFASYNAGGTADYVIYKFDDASANFLALSARTGTPMVLDFTNISEFATLNLTGTTKRGSSRISVGDVNRVAY